MKNGGEITGRDFKAKREARYADYADQIIEESMRGAIDWSIFDGAPLVMDGASGTQILIRGYGRMHHRLIN